MGKGLFVIVIGGILPHVLTGIEWIWRSVMNIAQITSVYISVPPKTHGGTERVVYHLCQQLDRRGHHVELFASGDSQVTCRLQAVLPVATQYDPQSTFYMEKGMRRAIPTIFIGRPNVSTSFMLTGPPSPLFFSAYDDSHTGHLRLYREGTAPILSETLSTLPSGMRQPRSSKHAGGRLIPVVYNGVDLDEIPFNDRPEDFFMIVAA
jgi:hypothetical protein